MIYLFEEWEIVISTYDWDLFIVRTKKYNYFCHKTAARLVCINESTKTEIKKQR